MLEAERGASVLEALCQQMTPLTQAVKNLQDGDLQLEGYLHTLTASVKSADQNPAASPASAAAPSSSSLAATSAVVLLPPEPRVPTPEHFLGDQCKFRAFKNACALYFALQPSTFALETVKMRFII